MNSGFEFREYASSGFANELNNGKHSFIGRVGPNGNGGYNWFKNGGAYHSLQEDIMKAEIGDVLFMGDENTGMRGHSSLILSVPELDKSTGYVEMTVLTSVTGGNSTIQSIAFTKNKNGNWVRATDGKEFKGYGQISKDFWWGGKNKSTHSSKGGSPFSKQFLQNKADEMFMENMLRAKAMDEFETLINNPPPPTANQ